MNNPLIKEDTIQIQKDERINERHRVMESINYRPALSMRMLSTKQSIPRVVNPVESSEVNNKTLYYAENIDVESVLRNQCEPRTNDQTRVYIPDSSSTLYNSNVEGFVGHQVVQPHPHLFHIEKSYSKQLKLKNKQLFNNNSKLNLF